MEIKLKFTAQEVKEIIANHIMSFDFVKAGHRVVMPEHDCYYHDMEITVSPTKIGKTEDTE